MAPKKTGLFLVIAGAVLIASALSLFLYNRHEDAQAGESAENLLAGVQAYISGIEPAESYGDDGGPSGAEPAATLPPELPIVEIDGFGYVGYLSIPRLELELPVLSDWDDRRLKLAPCRQNGSSRTDNLVIAAHNYEKHFGKLHKLSPGDKIIFTDMEGYINIYLVYSVETIQPTDPGAVHSSGHDLVLYTCTFGGEARVAVFCDRQRERAVQDGLRD